MVSRDAIIHALVLVRLALLIPNVIAVAASALLASTFSLFVTSLSAAIAAVLAAAACIQLALSVAAASF